MPKRLFSFIFPFVLAFGLLAPSAFAAKVKRVKGKQVIIDMESDSLSKGEIYYLVSGGKKRGIIKIRAVKGKAALAILGKGKASVGDSLEARKGKMAKKKSGSGSSRASEDKMADTTSSTDGKAGASYWGVVVGMGMTSADVSLLDSNGNAAGDVSLSGSGFSAKGLFDYPLLPYLGFRGLAGLEQFNVGGENNGVCGGECTAEITYISFDFWGRLLFGSPTMKFWVGGGFDLLFPMSKSATALDEGSITNTSIIGIGGGFDYYLSPTSYIPVQVEYGLYPSSDQVEASAIAFRVGYAMPF